MKEEKEMKVKETQLHLPSLKEKEGFVEEWVGDEHKFRQNQSLQRTLSA